MSILQVRNVHLHTSDPESSTTCNLQPTNGSSSPHQVEQNQINSMIQNCDIWKKKKKKAH